MSQQYLAPTYNTSYVYGIPTPTTQPMPNSQFLSKGWFNPEDPSGFYQPSSDYDVYRSIELDTSVQNGYYSNISQYQPTSETSAVFSPVPYPTVVPGSISTYATYTAPATPDFLPITEMTDDTPQRPTLSRADSKELIGIGLYDAPDRDSWSFETLMGGDHNARPLSLGKGLKLEETWEPPEEDDKTDDEEEEEEEEEGEEAEDEEMIEETIEQQLQQVVNNAPQAPIATTSEQSFFFDTEHIIRPQTGFGQQIMMPSF